jgi:hypothetical protein
MSEPIREKCDLCGKPIGKEGWTQWRLGFSKAERVAHTSCFEDFAGGAEGQAQDVKTNESDG